MMKIIYKSRKKESDENMLDKFPFYEECEDALNIMKKLFRTRWLPKGILSELL